MFKPQDDGPLGWVGIIRPEGRSGSLSAPGRSDTELRVATLDEAGQTVLDRLFEAKKGLVFRDARKRRWQEPKEGDLVLLQTSTTAGSWSRGGKEHIGFRTRPTMDDYGFALRNGGMGASFWAQGAQPLGRHEIVRPPKVQR